MLHYGFEKPTAEVMEAWNEWFESISDRTVDQGGFRGGTEISDGGTRDLPSAEDSITGYSIIEAEDLAAAEEVAKENPYVSSIRVYEIREANS